MSGVVWVHAGPSVLAAFLASAVECVEAMTVILALGAVRGWRDTVLGGLTAMVLLAVVVAVFGRALATVPLDVFQGVVGTLLLLFGLRWLHKAVLREAGILPKRNEAAIYQRQLQTAQGASLAGAWDGVAFGGSFQITMLEGSEVIFIVIAIGSTSATMLPASLGASLAVMVVLALALALRRPLTRVPENSLKFAVGVLLTALGCFWVGESFGLAWPGADWSILALLIGYLIVGLVTVRVCRRQSKRFRGPAFVASP